LIVMDINFFKSDNEKAYVNFKRCEKII